MSAEWDIEERDRIAVMTREQMLDELAEAFAECDRDDLTNQLLYDRQRYGLVGWITFTTYELREELYDGENIPAGEDRIHPEGERDQQGTLGQLVRELAGHLLDGNIDRSEWHVMMRHDLDGDVVIGARITSIKLDGFHQHVNLIGPKEETMDRSQPARVDAMLAGRSRPLNLDCQTRQLRPAKKQYETDTGHGYVVEQCSKPLGHHGHHRYRRFVGGAATAEEGANILRYGPRKERK